MQRLDIPLMKVLPSQYKVNHFDNYIVQDIFHYTFIEFPTLKLGYII